MNTQELDRLLIAYLHRELSDGDCERLRMHFDANPQTLKRVLELADEELLLGEALREQPRVIQRLASSRISRRITRRRIANARKTARAPIVLVFVAATVLLMRLLFVFHWTSSTHAAAVAALSQRSGHVEVFRGGKSVGNASADLFSDDQIKTGEGTALVVYKDGTTLEIASHSTVKFGDGAEGKRLTMQAGTLHCQAAKQPEKMPFVLQTPEAKTTVLGTVFRLSSMSGSTTLRVDEGVVSLADLATKASAKVAAGEMLVADNRRELTVAHMDSPESKPVPDTFAQEFNAASRLEAGTLDLNDAPQGLAASVKEVVGPGDHPMYFIRPEGSFEGLFAAHNDDVVHVTYKPETIGDGRDFELFLCFYPPEGWAFECNFVYREKMTREGWQTVDIPIGQFANLSHDGHTAEGLVCRGFFFESYFYTGLKVARIWVTRGK